MSQFGASLFEEPQSDIPKVGTLDWVKWDSKERKRLEKLKDMGGF